MQQYSGGILDIVLRKFQGKFVSNSWNCIFLSPVYSGLEGMSVKLLGIHPIVIIKKKKKKKIVAN